MFAQDFFFSVRWILNELIVRSRVASFQSSYILLKIHSYFVSPFFDIFFSLNSFLKSFSAENFAPIKSKVQTARKNISKNKKNKENSMKS